MTGPRITRLTAEHDSRSLVVGTPAPRLSWQTATDAPGWVQTHHELQITPDHGRPFRSRPVESGESVLVGWPAPPLVSRERRAVQVRVRGSDGSTSPWSDPVVVEAGLLAPDDWRAAFVGPAWDEDLDTPQPCPYLRREFAVAQPVTRARLYASALGVYELELNGERVGDHVLAPGWTSYHHHVRYDAFDVTPLLRDGANVLGGIVGDGWYRGALVEDLRRNRYGTRSALLCQLEVEHADGSTTAVVTDESWRASTGPIRRSGLYEGETYDARAELAGWSEPGFDDDGWHPVVTVAHDLATLRAPVAPPIRVTERIQPVGIVQSPSGKTIVDFGQNLVGVVELAVTGPAGTEVTIRHAEVLQDGELCTAPLRNAEATDRYTLRGGGRETWRPRFTFHGFRYAEITGWPGALDPADVRALVVHTDMRRTGWFECSDERVDQLHRNVVWGMRGNFVGIPTDCPQRDERLGWTGDINVFAPTATFLYDCAGVLESWLRDRAAEQRNDGTVPWVIPDSLEWLLPAAVWGDAAVTVPATVHERYGDLGIVRAQYRSMRSWVEQELAMAGDDLLWTGGFQFADWLDPTGRDGNAFDQRVDPDLLATAAMIHSLDLLAAAAELLDERDDRTRYSDLARRARDAFAREYVTPNGRLASDAQTAYALAIVYDLFADGEQRAHAGARLSHLAVTGGLTIATGFVGTPLVCDALTTTGHVDTAYGLLTQEQCPSWLYPVLQGATTIWERWDALTPDGRVMPEGLSMISFNHYALGAVADWLHRVVGGLCPAAPGWRELRIAPEPGGGLTRASSRLDTPYGLAASSWALGDGTVTVEAVVPPNTTAVVRLPGTDHDVRVGSGTHTWTVPYRPDAVAEPSGTWADAKTAYDAEHHEQLA
jgi:alpha-L-rhamnosidase